MAHSLDLFKITKAGYLISALWGGIWCLVLFYHSFWLAALIVLLWMLLCVWLFNRIANKRILQIDKLLTGDCDLIAYRDIWQTISMRRLDRATQVYVRLNLSTAYLSIGDTESAERVLFSIPALVLAGLPPTVQAEDQPFPRKRISATYEFCYHNNCCAYHLQTGDLLAAEQSLAQMERILQSGKLHKSHQGQFPSLYTTKQVLLRMAQGEYDGCEQFFTQAYQNAQNTLEKMTAQYTLGRIHLHQDQIPEAIDAFTYVINHGGSSVYKTKAIAYLETLGAPIPHIPLEIPKAIRPFPRRQARIIIFALCMLVALTFVSIFVISQNDEHRALQLRFYPTMEDAFVRHDRTHHTLGEVLFADEQANAVTILHQIDDSWPILSLFLRESREDGVFYALLSTGSGGWTINITQDPDAPAHFIPIEVQRSFIVADTNRPAFFALPAERLLDRRPLYGFANGEQVRRMTINGQLVDYVADLGPDDHGQPRFFWYFADAQVLHESDLEHDDVVFAFE